MDKLYIVTRKRKVLLETKCEKELGIFTVKLCAQYEKDFDGSHAVYVKKDNRYFYSHATWFSGSGEVASRGKSPQPDVTQDFLRTFGAR